MNIPEPKQISIEDMDIGLNFKIITFLFLPHQLEKFDEVVDLIEKDTEAIGIADIKYYDKLRDTIKQVKDIEDIRAVGMIISRMCDIVKEYYNEQMSKNTIEKI